MRIAVWIVLVVIYGGFWFWFNGSAGKLSTVEIANYMEQIEARPDADAQRVETLRALMESDDGKPIYVLNLIKMAETPKPVEGLGAGATAEEALNRYMQDHMLPEMLKRGSMPVAMGQAVGGYIDMLGVEKDEGWTTFGIVRYRSRRDMLDIAMLPGFRNAHKYKFAAMDKTFAFPTHPTMITPNHIVPLLLMLIGLITTRFIRKY
ncbi:MAG: hypothetical protein ACPG06_09645 [Alphaproteobacteria bacterium]